MNPLADQLVSLIASKEAVDGVRYLNSRDVYGIVSQFSEFNAQIPVSIAAEIIIDSRIDFESVRVSPSEMATTQSLASALLSHIEFSEHLPYSPEIGDSLRARYSASAIVRLLTDSACLPIGVSGSVMQEQAMCGRLAMMLIYDHELLQAWSDALHDAISQDSRSGVLGWISNTLRPGLRVTPKRNIGCLPVVLSLVGALSPESFHSVTDRNWGLSVYDFGDDSKFNYMPLGNSVCRENLELGLMVRTGSELDAFICEEIGMSPIYGGDSSICAALLASVPHWGALNLPIDQMLNLIPMDGAFSTADTMISRYAFKWHGNWFERAAENPLASPVIERIATAGAFDRWLSKERISGGQGALIDYKQLKYWVELMPPAEQHCVLDNLLRRFHAEISLKGKMSKGLMMGKVLVCAFPDNGRVLSEVRGRTGHIVKRTLRDSDLEFLVHCLDNDYVSERDMSECIRTIEEINRLTDSGEIDMKNIVPHLRGGLAGELACEFFNI